jgi:peptidylprolyl isomerase
VRPARSKHSLSKKLPAGIILSGAVILAGCSSSADDQSATDSSGVYLVNDCAVVLAPVEQEGAPEGIAVNGLVIGGGEVPVISVGPNSAPAQELQTDDLIPGNGASVAVGNTITVNYCGVGQSSGAIFDSSWARGAPATFDLVPGALIEGWTQGVPGMQVGERRLLQIPGELGYGSNPPPGIEANETLVFVVELVSIDS